MKKVVYAVTRYGKTGQTRVTGLGYITDTDLIIACQSKENKPYIRVFEDCIKDCHGEIEMRNKFYRCFVGVYIKYIISYFSTNFNLFNMSNNQIKSTGFHRCLYLTHYHIIYTVAETMDRPDFYHRQADVAEPP